MKTEYILEKFSSGMHFITLDKETVEIFTKNGNKRVLCNLNNQIEFHCAIMPRKDKSFFVNIGSTICKKLKISEGSKVEAKFSFDNSEYQFEIPEEFEEVLKLDVDANNVFQSLTDGNKRSLIYLVNQVKSSDKKIERSLRIAEKLKKGIASPKIILK